MCENLKIENHQHEACESLSRVAVESVVRIREMSVCVGGVGVGVRLRLLLTQLRLVVGAQVFTSCSTSTTSSWRLRLGAKTI